MKLKMWYHKKKERGVRSYVEKYHRTDSTKIHCTFECIDYCVMSSSDLDAMKTLQKISPRVFGACSASLQRAVHFAAPVVIKPQSQRR